MERLYCAYLIALFRQAAETHRLGLDAMVAEFPIRELNSQERQRLEDILGRFRAEFADWAKAHPNLWELLAFVQYEGIDLPIVREAEPYIRADKCVSLYGAKWFMLAVGDEWHFALNHSDFAHPVDITKFDINHLKRTLSRKWKLNLLKKYQANDSDEPYHDEHYDATDDLAVLLNAAPAAFERVLNRLENVSGMGRRIDRQILDHWLRVLDGVCRARDDGRLSLPQEDQFNEILRRLLPIRDRLKQVRAGLPQRIESWLNHVQCE